MFKIIVFVSGEGTNLEAIIKSCILGILDATVQLVVSNKPDTYAIQRATNHNINSLIVLFDIDKYRSRKIYDANIAKMINNEQYDLIVLTGWMHIFTGEFLNNIKSPIINLHPALPGEFPGLKPIERALEAYKKGDIKKTGIMVHHVIEKLDAGETIDTFDIIIRDNDTIDTLKHKFKYYEKFLLVSSIEKVLLFI